MHERSTNAIVLFKLNASCKHSAPWVILAVNLCRSIFLSSTSFHLRRLRPSISADETDYLAMRFLRAVAAATFFLACSSAPTANKPVLHEKRDGNLHQWERRSRAIPDHVMPIKIGLRQRNLENAEKYVYDVADPNSPNFGRSAFHCWMEKKL
jgi:hypothetical protein